MEGDTPKKGKRYKLTSRPWDMSYIDCKEDKNGDWVYDPIPDNQEIQPDEVSFINSKKGVTNGPKN